MYERALYTPTLLIGKVNFVKRFLYTFQLPPLRNQRLCNFTCNTEHIIMNEWAPHQCDKAKATGGSFFMYLLLHKLMSIQ